LLDVVLEADWNCSGASPGKREVAVGATGTGKVPKNRASVTTSRHQTPRVLPTTSSAR
jgi:hypothetical protein